MKEKTFQWKFYFMVGCVMMRTEQQQQCRNQLSIFLLLFHSILPHSLIAPAKGCRDRARKFHEKLTTFHTISARSLLSLTHHRSIKFQLRFKVFFFNTQLFFRKNLNHQSANERDGFPSPNFYSRSRSVCLLVALFFLKNFILPHTQRIKIFNLINILIPSLLSTGF